ncbi:hypothetical protein JCM3765_001488 [Sporobolomyces pararoseus]
MEPAIKKEEKINFFSLLPPELVDYIFELAASTYDLSSLPSSKALYSAHERALYRFVHFDHVYRLIPFGKTVQSHPEKALLAHHLFFKCRFQYHAAQFVPGLQHFLRRLSNLVEISSVRESAVVLTYHLTIGIELITQLKNLTVCRMPKSEVDSEIVEGLARIPSLREVELFGMRSEALSSHSTAPQVTRLFISGPGSRSRLLLPNTTTLLRSFPSARIVSFVLDRNAEEIADESRVHITPPIQPFLDPLKSSLQVLHLDTRRKLLGDLDVSKFSFLRDLHLGESFSDQVGCSPECLLSLTHLESLSLVLSFPLYELLKLLKGPQRLRHLRSLTLRFAPIKSGDAVDIKVAEEELAYGDGHYDEEGTGLACLRVANFDEMGGGAWELPLGLEASVGLSEIVELEETTREAGVIIKTNLNEVRRGFHRQLVEYFSRGIAYFYLYGSKSFIEDALDLAKTHEMELPSIEIDLNRKYKKDQLEWYKVDMTRAVGGGGRKCYALNLRYKA